MLAPQNILEGVDRNLLVLIRRTSLIQGSKSHGGKTITEYINTKIDTEESTIRANLTFLQRKGVPYDNQTDGLVFRQKGGKHSEIEIALMQHE